GGGNEDSWPRLHFPEASAESLTFGDVTVTFTPLEWIHLDADQQALYRDVVMENYGNLVSVGKDIFLLNSELRHPV
uniref:KRAB domain-containing protein n=1 Tax=Spermophilus dauricus TaxID=99837 RepID=A0A8C9QA00_SPEDA